MSIEEIRIDTATLVPPALLVNGRQRLLQKRISVIAIMQSRPEIDLPCETPAGADVAAQCQSLPRSGEQFGCAGRCNLVARKRRP